MQLIVRLAMLLLLGTATPLSAKPLRDPSDPGAPVAPQRYRSIREGIRSFRPVEPKPWSQTNKSVAPPLKSSADPKQKN